MILHASFDEVAMKQADASSSEVDDLVQKLAESLGFKKRDVIEHALAEMDLCVDADLEVVGPYYLRGMLWLPSVTEYWQQLKFDGCDVIFFCSNGAAGNAGWSGEIRLEKNKRVLWSYSYADNEKSTAKNRAIKMPVLKQRGQLTSRLLVEFSKFFADYKRSQQQKEVAA
tara:strand:- start:96 stop:605 length:510 start_codon:yes stop_codon:yes gene_type:complete